MNASCASSNGRQEAPEIDLTETEPGQFLLTGELSFASVARALTMSTRLFSGSSHIVFDLSGLYRTDSAGIALLLEWQRRALEAGARLEFIHPPEQLLAIARVAGVDGIFLDR